MGSLQRSACLTLASFVVAGASPALAHEEQEILVGRSAAGEIHVHMDFNQPVELPVSIFPGVNGYAFGELAFHSTILDEPDEDLFPLSTAANLRFVLLAKDPGVEVWNDTGSGFMTTNETFFIGPSPFDTHPIWNIVNGTPGGIYSLTLKLRDLNNIYADSDPFTLSFTPARLDPHISIQPADFKHITLIWPTNAANWELQSAASVITTNWATIVNVPIIIGTNQSVTIPISETHRFFRLRKP